MKDYPTDMAWAVVQAKNQPYAVATQDLREMVIMPEVAEVPNTGEYVRGVINLRGRVLPLIDLRKRIGLTSAAEETDALCAMLEQREKDHHNWLNELEATVKENRAFHLATDPHQCAFGKWYDSYHPENQLVAMHLKKFDVPHRYIHSLAGEVRKLMSQGRTDRAHELLDGARAGTLARLTELFSELRSLVRDNSREIALEVEGGGKQFALSVDSALSVERLAAGSIEELQAGVGVAQNGVLWRFGRRNKGGEVILILETALLMDGAELGDLVLEPAGSNS